MKKALKARGVKFLVHFTRESNIDSIIQHGLLPKNEQKVLPSPAEVNDTLRLDFREDASSLSIGFPNYKLFYRFRKETEEQKVEWGVIVFSKKVLLDKECLFCPTNAADSSVSSQDENTLKGVKAFNALYSEIKDKPSRQKVALPASFPTNPQAEVLVKDVIEPEYILAVVFNNSVLTKKYKSKYPKMDIRTFPDFFNARNDYTHW